MKELKGQTKIYYQVLMDNRDSPYTVGFAISQPTIFEEEFFIEHLTISQLINNHSIIFPQLIMLSLTHIGLKTYQTPNI